MKGSREKPHLLIESAPSDTGGLLKTGVISILIHIILIVFLTLNLKPAIPKGGSSVYRVTIRPFSSPGNGFPQGGSGPAFPGPPGKVSIPASAEKSDIVEREKPQKKGKKFEKEVLQPTKKPRDEIPAGLKKSPKKGERLEREKISRESLQEAIEDIRKKAALDQIQRRVAQRGRLEKGSIEGQQASGGSQESVVSSRSGSGSGTGAGPGAGTGSGSGTGIGTGGSPGGSVLDDYYSAIWAKIKKVWTLPENLPKGKTELEAIIVVVIEREGKIQKMWFEKRSGNALYDQMAMRAIKKAEPLPPIPQEFSDSTFEIGIRFYPD
jgi:colicin import membrane protein